MSLTLLKDVAGLRASAQPARALRLAAEATAQRARLGRTLGPADQTGWERQVEALRAALDDDVAATAWADGQTMTLDQAIADALEG